MFSLAEIANRDSAERLGSRSWLGSLSRSGDRVPLRVRARRVMDATPFADFPGTPASHFQLYFYAGRVAGLDGGLRAHGGRGRAAGSLPQSQRLQRSSSTECGVGDLRVTRSGGVVARRDRPMGSGRCRFPAGASGARLGRPGPRRDDARVQRRSHRRGCAIRFLVRGAQRVSRDSSPDDRSADGVLGRDERSRRGARPDSPASRAGPSAHRQS